MRKQFTESPGGGKKKAAEKDSAAESVREKEQRNEDYWERIAEDPASGYKNEENDDPLLNVDQLPGDNKKGDQTL